jgi:hypothetical protein
MSEQSFLQFDDLREYVAEGHGTEGWISVYEYADKDRETIAYYCALVDPNIVDACLSNTSWDLLIGHGMPGFTSYPDGTQRYYRFGDDDGIEPFIVDRDFRGLKSSYLELSEEFRHFHNLL